MNTARQIAVALLLSFVAVVACKPEAAVVTPAPAVDAAAKGAVGAVALVNGVALTDADVGAELRARKSKGTLTPEQRVAFVETLVDRELAAQKAAALGLGDDAFKNELALRAAELAAWRRQHLSEAYLEHEAALDPQEALDEARRYFEANASAIRTEVRIWQILGRDESQVSEAKREIDGGAAFEAVAAKRFPNLPEGSQPWDLGYLKWKQVPDAWRGVLPQLQPGDISGVIPGQGGRYWIIKLVERREDPSIEFEQVREVLLGDLKAARLEQTRTRASGDLRKSARVEILPAATP